jgi:hypothetical protein
MEVKDAVQKPNVLVFAPERARLIGERKRFDGRNFTISYEPLDTKRRLDEYDGVLVFQRTFENLTYKTGNWEGYWEHSVYQDDLDRRTKETKLLLDKGGFVCFVLCHPLVDRDGSRSFETTDLVKRYLRGPTLYRYDFGSRVVNVRSSINEFERFIASFGAAYSHFRYYADDASALEIRPFATAGGHIVGMIFGSQVVFIPSMIPTWSVDVAQEYFEVLIDAIVTTLRKLKVDVPLWARELKFEEESELAAKKQELLQELSTIDARAEEMDRMKRVLVADGTVLVEEVAFVLEHGLNFQTEVIENFKEDLKLLSDDRSELLALCEVKGMNRGVKREHINQADSHRERANLPDDFPTLLIVNTGIKSARSVEEKNQAIDSEQIRHAAQIHVLVLRTIDLLYLIKLRLSERISKDQVRELFLREVGWLKVDEDGWSVQTS